MCFWKRAYLWSGNAPPSLHGPQISVHIKFFSNSFLIFVVGIYAKWCQRTRCSDLKSRSWIGVICVPKILSLNTECPTPWTSWNVIRMLIIWKRKPSICLGISSSVSHSLCTGSSARSWAVRPLSAKWLWQMWCSWRSLLANCLQIAGLGKPKSLLETHLRCYLHASSFELI